MAVPSASAQAAAESQPSQEDIAVRDNLIANQENLLNTYRCLFGVDTDVVPGGCPNPDTVSPRAAPENPTQQDIEVRDELIQNQEALLNVYRCQFNVDTQIVPGGCPTPTDQPTPPTELESTQSNPPGQFTAISTGENHACGIRIDKTVACWGNFQHQTDVPAGRFTVIAAGSGFSCGIRTDKAVECWGWGYDRSGELAERFRERQQSAPVPWPNPVVPDGQFIAISASLSHACGIRTDNTVICWGDLPGSEWVEDVPAGQFTAISVGIGASCGIRTDKAVRCWGSNYIGQLDSLNSIGGQFTAISVDSSEAACGIKTDKSAVCWGSVFGSVPELRAKPTAIEFQYSTICEIRTDKTAACGDVGFTIGGAATGLFEAPKGQFTAISPGGNLVCGIKTDKTVLCWGPLWLDEANPPVGPFAAIAAEGRHSCAIRTDQSAICWGNHISGQATAPAGTFTAITAGGSHSCAIRTDQTAICWGNNYYGLEFAGQSNAPAGTFTAISAGGIHSCAIRTDQTAICWGDDRWGQSNAPAGTFTAISAGGSHSCAIRTDQTAICWGNNSSAQATAPAGTFTAISVGGSHSCAIRTDRTAICWGNNEQGQSDAPAGMFAAITATNGYSCAIRTDKSAVCWGNNDDDYVQPPDAPAGMFAAIASGHSHTCAIRTDKSAVCWNWSWSTSVPDGVQWVLPGSDDLGEILSAEAEMARLVNELRQGLGLAPLTYNPGLANVARGWSRTMRDTGQFVHNPIYSRQYPPGATRGGENIATVRGATLLEAVQIAFGGLVASPGHYANMTSPDFNHFGIGIAVEGSSFWFTQNFARYP